MKKVLVIDVETIDIKDLDIFEIGYTLLDLEDGTSESKGMILKEVYESDLFPKAHFYEANKDSYAKMLEAGDLTMVTVEEAKEELNRIFKVHRKDIAYISAFNMQFDIRALNYTFNKYLNLDGRSHITYEKFMKAGMLPIDSAVLFSVFEIENGCYKCFCQKNGFYTGKGNIKTTAEIVYKYVKNDLNFQEKHMGIYDSEIEANIFEYAMTRCIHRPELINKAHQLTLRGTKPYIIFKNAR